MLPRRSGCHRAARRSAGGPRTSTPSRGRRSLRLAGPDRRDEPVERRLRRQREPRAGVLRVRRRLPVLPLPHERRTRAAPHGFDAVLLDGAHAGAGGQRVPVPVSALPERQGRHDRDLGQHERPGHRLLVDLPRRRRGEALQPALRRPRPQRSRRTRASAAARTTSSTSPSRSPRW